MLDWLQNNIEPEAQLTQYMKHGTHFYIENGGFRKKILHSKMGQAFPACGKQTTCLGYYFCLDLPVIMY